MKRAAFTSTLLAALYVGPALAQDEATVSANEVSSETDPLSRPVSALDGRAYIAPMASHTWEDKDRETEDGWGGALAIGKHLNSSLAVELNGFYSQFQTNAKSMKLYGGGLSALFFPSQASGLFGLVGGKYVEGKKHPNTISTTTDPNGILLPPGPITTRSPGPGKRYDSVAVDVGVGYLLGPFSWLNYGSLRAEALVRHDLHEDSNIGLGDGLHDDFVDTIVNIGALIPIGAPPTPPPPPEAPEPPVEVVPVTAPVDSDGDGVTDDLDQCPGTPAGEAVNEVGCPLPKKECKTPEPGQPVTLEGCAAGDKIVLRGVNFDFNKANLTSNARTILDGVSSALTAAPGVNVEVGGHTDAKGSDEYNQKLSEKRAASVEQYLIGSGIDSSRMTSQGYGESQPVADNETDEGRELNRRVELKVTSGAAEVAPVASAAEPAPVADPAATDGATPDTAPAADAMPADAAPAEAPAP